MEELLFKSLHLIYYRFDDKNNKYSFRNLRGSGGGLHENFSELDFLVVSYRGDRYLQKNTKEMTMDLINTENWQELFSHPLHIKEFARYLSKCHRLRFPKEEEQILTN